MGLIGFIGFIGVIRFIGFRVKVWVYVCRDARLEPKPFRVLPRHSNVVPLLGSPNDSPNPKTIPNPKKRTTFGGSR